ncbi:MAG: EF-hand domain-containing protein [bacterium]|nr:EF-hand domain-containing protein [bacterium]
MISGISQYMSPLSSATTMSTRPRPEEMFAKMNTNGDEYVDKAEFSSFHQQLTGKTDDAGRLDEMFAKIDTDGDGKISKAEDTAFLASMKDRPAPPPSEDSEENPFGEIFSAMDVNGDGSVDKTELESYLLKLTDQAEPKNSSDELFAMIDSDGDGTISKSENDDFVKMLTARMAARYEEMSSEDSNDSLSTSLNLAAQRYSSTQTGDSQSILNLQA